MRWRNVSLGDYVKIKTGKLDANASNENGKYPFFTCSKKHLLIDEFAYDCECVLVAGNGDLNVKYYNGKFNAYQRTYIIESVKSDLLSVKYLYYFMNSYIEVLREQSIGGVIKYIKLGNLTSAQIPLPPIEIQKRIVDILDKFYLLIEKRKEQITVLDKLTNDTFIDMFGQPISNPKGWETKKIGEIADIKIGPFGTSLHVEDYISGGISLVNPQHIANGKIQPRADFSITNEKFAELSSYHLRENDIVLARRGEIGRCAVVIPEQLPLICGTGSMIIRLHDGCSAYYLQNVISYPTYSKFMESKATGSTMKNLNSGIVSGLAFPFPPIELQLQYVSRINAIETQKDRLQKSLTLLEETYKAAIQKALSGELFHGGD